MNKAIIIHGWEESPSGHWYPWLGKKLEEEGWQVDIPEMPNTKNPKLNQWMDKLLSFSPDNNTLLIGHSLANALIMKYLENSENKAKGAVMVAAWDWLMEDVKEFHQTFFESGFNYETIKSRNLPLFIVNSSNDPWIDFAKAKNLSTKIKAKFIAVANAGHFMDRDGYREFPKLLEIINDEISLEK